tara:strand:+ start:425 stop:730 length:306 start_codon:yes stop_codon:yes gene_type:complete
MFAVIVRDQGWGSGMLRPFVAEVTRDRPKTLFTKSKYGENRYAKDQHCYQLFDTEAEACEVLIDMGKRLGIFEAEKATQTARALEKLASEMVSEVVASWRT